MGIVTTCDDPEEFIVLEMPEEILNISYPGPDELNIEEVVDSETVIYDGRMGPQGPRGEQGPPGPNLLYVGESPPESPVQNQVWVKPIA